MSLVDTGTAPAVDLTFNGTAAGAESTVSHLVQLPGTRWNLWRTLVIRGAGFPAAMIEELSAQQTAAAADHYLACRALASRHTDAALRRLRGELAGSAELRQKLEALKAAIATGGMEELSNHQLAATAAETHAKTEQARELFLAAYQAETEAIHDRLMGFAGEPRFREAMLWQGLDPTHHIWHNLQPESPAHARRKAL